MPRNRKRKTTIGLTPGEKMLEGLKKIREGHPIKAVARTVQIPYTTLQRYHTKHKDTPIELITDLKSLTPNYAVRKLFSDDQEKSIHDYIVQCSQMFYGLTTTDTLQLVYETARLNNVKVPEKWHTTSLAGVEWLHGFRKRHPDLSLRTPEGCSLGRATSFNRHNVNQFYDNLEIAMSRQEVFGNGTRVYNLDETSTITVQKSSKVFAPKGQKNVSKVTSAERGTLVTTCYIINALGHALPPVMILPRVHFKDHMIKGAPTGTLGLAQPSGWMNAELFVKTMQHFIQHSNSSKSNPSLLILDNHESHINIEALNLAKDSGVTILTVPPHTTGKLQPLDVGVYGPFKTAYNKAVDSWMMRNNNKPVTIYEVAELVNEAHLKSMTPANICSAFRATGIFPFDRNLFTDIDFAPSEVSDRPNPENIQIVDDNIGEKDRLQDSRTPSPSLLFGESTLTSCSQERGPPNSSMIQNAAHAETSRTPLKQIINQQPIATSVQPSTSSTSTQAKFISPFEFRGLPKAGPRKRTRAPRRRGKTMIATDTPNKLEIEKRADEKNKKKAKLIKKKVLQSDSSSDEENDNISIYSEEEAILEEEDDEQIVDPKKFIPLQELPAEGSFILVEFEVKERKIYYIAKVLGEKGQDVEVSFLRKSAKNPNKFHLPNVPDIATVALRDIKMNLPQPAFTGTKRTQGLYNFELNFEKINLR